MNIIFDFDGVIINSHKIKSLAFYEVFKKFGKTYAKKALNYHLLNIGKSRYYKFKFILKNIIRLQANSELIKNLDKEYCFCVCSISYIILDISQFLIRSRLD